MLKGVMERNKEGQDEKHLAPRYGRLNRHSPPKDILNISLFIENVKSESENMKVSTLLSCFPSVRPRRDSNPHSIHRWRMVLIQLDDRGDLIND